MTLSRHDRAAMTLALECLRERGAAQFRALFALDALDLGGDVSGALWSAARYSTEPCHRILRARLALALRVLLRADAGDFGPRYRVPTGRTCRRVDHNVEVATHRCRTDACGCYRDSRQVRPLWEQAPAHEAAR